MPKRNPVVYWFNTIFSIAIIVLFLIGGIYLIIHFLNASNQLQQKQQLQNNLYNSISTVP